MALVAFIFWFALPVAVNAWIDMVAQSLLGGRVRAVICFPIAVLPPIISFSAFLYFIASLGSGFWLGFTVGAVVFSISVLACWIVFRVEAVITFCVRGLRRQVFGSPAVPVRDVMVIEPAAEASEWVDIDGVEPFVPDRVGC